MRTALLDVNVLLAIVDAEHQHHRIARDWLSSNDNGRWASCAVTENGFVRVISRPRYPRPVTLRHAVAVLRAAQRHDSHEFWPCDISLLDEGQVEPGRLVSPRQVTDTYLLALATHHSGRLVTLDRSIAVGSVPGASADNLLVLG